MYQSNIRQCADVNMLEIGATDGGQDGCSGLPLPGAPTEREPQARPVGIRYGIHTERLQGAPRTVRDQHGTVMGLYGNVTKQH